MNGADDITLRTGYSQPNVSDAASVKVVPCASIFTLEYAGRWGSCPTANRQQRRR